MASYLFDENSTALELNEILSEEVAKLTSDIGDLFDGHNTGVVLYALGVAIGESVPRDTLLEFLTDLSDVARETSDQVAEEDAQASADDGQSETQNEKSEPQDTLGELLAAALRGPQRR